MTGLNLAAADKWSGSPEAKLFPNFGEFIWEFICLNFCDSNVIFWSTVGDVGGPATNQVSKAGRWIWLVPSLKLTACTRPENRLSRKETIGCHFRVFHVSFRECSSMFFQNNCWGCTHDWCWRGWCNWKLSNVSSAHQTSRAKRERCHPREHAIPKQVSSLTWGLKLNCLFSFHHNLVNNVADFKPNFYEKWKPS